MRHFKHLPTGKRTDLNIGALLSLLQHFLDAEPFWFAYTCVQPGKPATTVYFGLCYHLVSSACTCSPSQKYAHPIHDQNLRPIGLSMSTLKAQGSLSCVLLHMCAYDLDPRKSPGFSLMYLCLSSQTATLQQNLCPS